MEAKALEGWMVDRVRLTHFVSDIKDDHSTWWELFTGAKETSFISKRLEGESLYSGEFLGGTLELRIMLDRIDWILSSEPRNNLEEVFLGDYASLLKKLLSHYKEWLAKCSFTSTRCAFAASILNPVNTLNEGYKEIASLLPFLPIASGEWQDFYFQINKIAEINYSEGKRININRLINSSVNNFQMVNFQTGSSITSKYFTRFEFDINTQPDKNIEIDSDEVGLLLPFLTDISSVITDIVRA